MKSAVKKYRQALLPIALICWLQSFLPVLGQQTILNIPSTDVLDKGKTQVKGTVRFSPFQDGFVNGVPNVTHGLGFGTEMFLAFPIGAEKDLISQDYNTLVQAGIGVKIGRFITPKTKIAAGWQIAPSLQNASTPATVAYFLLSQSVPKIDVRLTSGMYLRNTREFLNQEPGVLLGLEKPIIANRFLLVTDWVSRNEPYGLLSAGFIYRPTATTGIKGGVLIPNGNRARFGFIIAASKTF